MQTFLAIVGALCLAGMVVLPLVGMAIGSRTARRAKAQTAPQMDARLAPYMVRAIDQVPRQRRRTFSAVTSLTDGQVDRFIADLYPCGAMNPRCQMHASNPLLCTDETPCCDSCPDRRPPAA